MRLHPLPVIFSLSSNFSGHFFLDFLPTFDALRQHHFNRPTHVHVNLFQSFQSFMGNCFRDNSHIGADVVCFFQIFLVLFLTGKSNGQGVKNRHVTNTHSQRSKNNSGDVFCSLWRCFLQQRNEKVCFSILRTSSRSVGNLLQRVKQFLNG